MYKNCLRLVLNVADRLPVSSSAHAHFLCSYMEMSGRSAGLLHLVAGTGETNEGLDSLPDFYPGAGVNLCPPHAFLTI